MNQSHYKDLLEFDTTNVINDLTTHSMNQCEVGFKTAQADQEYQTAKLSRKQVEADTYLSLREQAAQDGERVTETVLASRVTSSTNVKEAFVRELNEANNHANWKALDEAYKTRSILLASAAKFAMANGA